MSGRGRFRVVSGRGKSRPQKHTVTPISTPQKAPALSAVVSTNRTIKLSTELLDEKHNTFQYNPQAASTSSVNSSPIVAVSPTYAAAVSRNLPRVPSPVLTGKTLVKLGFPVSPRVAIHLPSAPVLEESLVISPTSPVEQLLPLAVVSAPALPVLAETDEPVSPFSSESEFQYGFEPELEEAEPALAVGVYKKDVKSDPESKTAFLEAVVVQVNMLNEVCAPQQPFSWWQPWTWYRNGTRVWSKFSPIKLVSEDHRGVHEESSKCLRGTGDMYEVVVTGNDSHWNWMPARAKPEYKTVVSQQIFNQLSKRYTAEDMPSTVRTTNYVEHLASVSWPRDIVDVKDPVTDEIKKISFVGAGVSTLNLFTDVKYVSSAESRRVFPFGPGWQGLPDLYSLVIANPTCSLLLYQLRNIYQFIVSMTVWRAVVQSMVVSSVTWLTLLYLPHALAIPLQRSLGSYLGLPGHHLMN